MSTEPQPGAAAPLMFGPRIRAARVVRGLSLRELARRLQISPATLSHLETGKAGVSAARLYRIAEILQISADALAGVDTLAAAGPRLERVVPSPGDFDWRIFPARQWDPVLEAAVKAFVQVGYHGATVRDIAVRANLSVPGLYHYHRGKQDMLLAILDLTMAELLARATAARRSGADPAERFARLIECLALYHTYRREQAFIGASEMRSLEPANRERITRSRNALQRMIDREVEAAVADGTFRTTHPHEAARAVVTMCTALVQWYRPDGPQSPEAIAAQYVDFAFDVMLPRDEARVRR